MSASIPESLKHYSYYTGFIGFLLSFLVFRNAMSGRRRNPRALPRPPGPKGYPLIGNLFSLPINYAWLVYDEWQKVYGDMVYMEVFGQPFLILGSLHRTTDLLEKRSSISSDRPQLVMMSELMGLDFHMPLLNYGPLWRRHRRTFHQFFHKGIVSSYEPVQTRETINLILRLLKTPDEFVGHIQHIFQATVMNTMYGIKVQETGDPYLGRINEMTEGVTEAGVPGRFLVDLIPILKYVPSWFPGAGFKQFAAHQSSLNKKVVELPFEEAERRLKTEKMDGNPSMAAVLLQQLPDGDILQREEERKIAQAVVATAALAGADTTFATVHTFFLAIAMYPDVQRRAQSEIDRVVGSKRLPDFKDRESLPYVNAIVKESLRWSQVAPLGMPHTTSEDMEYDGYFIPKGTFLIGNAWSIMHDAEEYSNPEEFCPERFLKDGQLNPQVRQPDSAAFGFGRRVCPGKDFALNSLFSIVSSILAVYDIAPATDSKGQPIKLEANFLSGLICSPAPFRCTIKPRNDAVRSLIMELSERQNK